MNKIAAAAKSTDWVIVYRGLLLFVLGITAWLAIQVYNGLQNGTTASAQTAQKAVEVASDAKASIAVVASDVSSIQVRQQDNSGVVMRLSKEVDKISDVVTASSVQLSAISQKLDDMSSGRERVGQLNSSPSP